MRFATEPVLDWQHENSWEPHVIKDGAGDAEASARSPGKRESGPGATCPTRLPEIPSHRDRNTSQAWVPFAP